LGNAIVAVKGRVRDSQLKSIGEIKTLCKRIAKYPRPEAFGETVKSLIEILTAAAQKRRYKTEIPFTTLW
jgi:hypothetical protein